MEGKVKFFNEAKGFGFIVPEDGGQDIFVHANEVSGTIKQDDRVKFETEKGKKGMQAINVKRA